MRRSFAERLRSQGRAHLGRVAGRYISVARLPNAEQQVIVERRALAGEMLLDFTLNRREATKLHHLLEIYIENT